MKQKIFLVVAVLAAAVTLTACNLAPASTNRAVTNNNTNQPAEQASDTSTQIANPASVNCDKQGGTLLLKDKVVDGQNLGQYGICYFEDNRQCEEWAMMRGDCPVGGLKVTGYATVAATYCAITGGTYTITKQESGEAPEQGNCTLKSGKACDVWKYYKGECPTE